MDRTYRKVLLELLREKSWSIVDFVENQSVTERKKTLPTIVDLLSNKSYFSQFVKCGKLDLIMPIVSSNPKSFHKVIMDFKIKVPISTKDSHWMSSTRTREFNSFHYDFPELVEFSSCEDISQWLQQSSKFYLPYQSLIYVIRNVIPNLTKNPERFSSQIRSKLRTNYLPLYKENAVDDLMSDGDTLLNTLFTEEKFKEYIVKGIFPTKSFVESLELNCTLSAMTKDRSSKHGKRVAKNLKRAKILLEVKSVTK